MRIRNQGQGWCKSGQSDILGEKRNRCQARVGMLTLQCVDEVVGGIIDADE